MHPSGPSNLLTISWVLTHSGPGHFSPAPAWTTLALAWDRPSCPCLEERKKHTVGVRGQMDGRWHWCDTDRDRHRQCNDSQARMSSLKDGEVEGWTPTQSATPFLKLTQIRWRGAAGFNFGKCTHTHTCTRTLAPTHIYTYPFKHVMHIVAKLRVCVTQFGLVLYPPPSCHFWGGNYTKHKHTNQYLRHYREVNPRTYRKFFSSPTHILTHRRKKLNKIKKSSLNLIHAEPPHCLYIFNYMVQCSWED